MTASAGARWASTSTTASVSWAPCACACSGAPGQAFFRLGEVILEVIQMPPAAVERAGGEDAPTRLWGLALNAHLERALAALAPHVGEAHAAVQQGRRIATLRRSADLAVPVALMSPPPPKPG